MLPRLAHLLVPALVLAAPGCRPSGDDIYAALPAAGSAVPAFRYTALDGSPLSPVALRGEPAVVALWASDCSASRRALAALGALHAEYAPRGARIVILADDRERAAVDSLLRRAGVQTPVALTGGTLMNTFTHGQSALPWRKAFALPTFLVLDAAGRVAYRQIGIELEPHAQLGGVRAQLDSLLAGTRRAAAGAPAA